MPQTLKAWLQALGGTILMLVFLLAWTFVFSLGGG